MADGRLGGARVGGFYDETGQVWDPDAGEAGLSCEAGQALEVSGADEPGRVIGVVRWDERGIFTVESGEDR